MKNKFFYITLFFLVILVTLSFSTEKVCATQSMSGNYYGFTKTGNKAEDIAACAEAQVGRSQSSLEYTEPWCADFVADCAKLAGASDLIPADGYVSNLYNAVINNGASIVSTPQRGDLIFYYCSSCNGYMHAGIMTSSSVSVDGNNWTDGTSRVYLNTSGYYYDENGHNTSSGIIQKIYVRPNYDVKPTLDNLHIHTTSTTQDKIRVRVLSSSNTTSVKFKIWRSGFSRNSGTTKVASYNNQDNCWEVYFDEADTKNINDNVCCVEAWGYNSNNTESEHIAIYNFAFAKRVYDLGNFAARIVYKNNSNYCIGISGNGNGDDLKLKTKNKTDKSQLWNFEEISDGLYKITNVSNGKSMDIDGGKEAKTNGCAMQLWGWANSPQMKFLLQSYNGGYRIIPSNSATLNSINLKDNSVKENASIDIWETLNKNNDAQTWAFEMVPTEVSLSEESITMNVGSEKKVNVNITPITLFDKTSLVWNSSNEDIVIVNEDGVITGVEKGTARISVYSKERPDLIASCEINVVDTAKSFSLNYETYQINSLNENIVLKATLDNGEQANVTWKSTKTNVATVNSSGVVTPINGGFTYIEAQSEKFGIKKCWIYVCTLITLNDGSKAYAGDLDRNGLFNSNDAAIILGSIGETDEETLLMCDIDGNNIVDKEDSNCILDMYKYNEPFRTGKYNPITQIVLSQSKLDLNEGECIQINASICPEDSTDSKNLTWKSSNSLIADVDTNGKVTAISGGTAIITAQTSNGKIYATCEVRVNGNELEITTIENKLIASKYVMKFTPKVQFKSIVKESNFPILKYNYMVKIYESQNGALKGDNEKIGSRNIIKVIDNTENVIAEYIAIVPGDVTGNGEVKMYDAFTILKDSLFNGKLDEIETLIRDFNNDGEVKMYDAFSFLKEALFN